MTPRAAPTAFPEIEVRSLTGERLVLPSGFAAARAVAVVAFERRQQDDVDTWLPALLELEAARTDLGVCEIPCIGRRWSPARPFIDGGMTAAIADRDARARTLTAYTDVDRVRRALGLRDTTEIAVVLTGRDGRIPWIGTGPWTPGLGAALAGAL